MDSLSSLLFTGVISSSDNGTYNVCVDPYGSNTTGIVQAIPLAQIYASTLGFKECPVYPTGANVLCYHITAERAYIIGIIPDADIAKMKFYSRACLQTADGNFDNQNSQGYAKEAVKMITHNQQRPTDVTEGEHVIANEFGVLLGLFQTMAALKGSELAQIQCYMLDDLVRIVSHNFQHWTALGELNIWHDGKAIMAEIGATHLSSESIGIPSVEAGESNKTFKEGGKPKPDDSEDYYEFEQDERIKAIERLKVFVGRLGDFLHLFLVRPNPTAIRTLAGALEGKYDTGLADIHVGIDGRICVRSVAGIFMEKTNWIPVPHRIRTPDDPKGDKAEEVDYPTKDPFEFDNANKYQDNPQLYFLQIRDCAAYLQDLYNYKNFMAHKEDFKISTGPNDNETKLNDITELDPKTQVKLSDYKLRKSGIYLMDNGGIAMIDAWGSSYVMEGGNIYRQAAKDIVDQPMRNQISKVGQFYSVAAKKDLDLSSTEGGLRLKTHKLQHLYSKEQGFIFHTDAVDLVEPRPDEEAYEEFGGILFKAKDTAIYSYASKICDTSTKSAMYRSKEKMVIRSEDDIWIVPDKHLYLMPTENLIAALTGQLTMLTTGTALLGGAASTAIGQKGKIIGIVPSPSNKLGGPYDGVLEISDLVEAYDSQRDSVDDLIKAIRKPFDEDEKFEDVKFRFLASDKYKLEDKEDFIPMTVAQQNDEAFGFLDLTEWKEEEITETLPYPGKDKFASFYATSKLMNLQDLEKDIGSKDTTALDKKAETIEFKDLGGYKILEK